MISVSQAIYSSTTWSASSLNYIYLSVPKTSLTIKFLVLYFASLCLRKFSFPYIEKNQYFWSENFEGNFVVYLLALGFPGGSVSKESACNVGDLGLIPGLGRSPGEGSGNLPPVFLLGEFHGQRSLLGYSPWVTGSDMTEWFSLLHFFFSY